MRVVHGAYPTHDVTMREPGNNNSCLISFLVVFAFQFQFLVGRFFSPNIILFECVIETEALASRYSVGPIYTSISIFVHGG